MNIKKEYKIKNPENVKALERDEFQCMQCNSKRNLIVHHKDRNRNNGKLDNLVTLCRFCHAKEHGISFYSNFSGIKIDKELIEELKQNLTQSEIGEYLGISRQSVSRILKETLESDSRIEELNSREIVDEQYMTKADVTARLKLKDIRTVDNLIRRGKLKAIKIGRLYRVLKSSFDELVSKTL